MENSHSSSSRLIHLDLLRILAAFAVIMIHVAADHNWALFYSEEWVWRTIYKSISRWSVPVFVMISGALFLNKTKKIEIKTIYTKYVKNALLVFLIWSLIYELSLIHRYNGISEFIDHVINGPFHFWFLKMLIGLYIAVPILKLISENKKLTVYFLWIWFFTSFVLPLINHLLDFGSENALRVYEMWTENLNLYIALNYSGYFLLGHYLINNIPNKRNSYFLYILAIISAALMVFATTQDSLKIGKQSDFFQEYFTLFALFETLAVFVFILRNFSDIPEKYHSLIVKAAKMSFGIYVVHVLVIWRVNTFLGLNLDLFDSSWFIPVFSLIIFAISYLVTWILYQIPYLRFLVDWSKTSFKK